MAIVYFPSLDQGDVVEVVFLKPSGGAVSMFLLVDSGFTGQSCFVLPTDAEMPSRWLKPPPRPHKLPAHSLEPSDVSW